MGGDQSKIEELEENQRRAEERSKKEAKEQFEAFLERQKEEQRRHEAALQKERETRAEELRRAEDARKKELKEVQETLRREQLKKDEARQKALEEEKLREELRRIELQKRQEEQLKERRIEEEKRASQEMIEREIQQLRGELENLKPGDSIEFSDGNIEFPEMLNVGLFGTTGIGKSSLLNSLKFAFKGELTELTREQTSTDNFQGGNTVRRLAVQITRHLVFVDNRGVGAEDLETVDAGLEIIKQLEGRSSFAEKVNWRKPSRSKGKGIPVKQDKRIYCTILVFNAQNPESVYTVLKKLVDQIFEWQGRYPIAVITHVDEATPEQLENMYVVLNSAGLVDTYEVANITKSRRELNPEHQLNLLKLMKRCIKEGDSIFSLREEIEQFEVQQDMEREREAEEERLEKERVEREREQARRAKEAEDARIKKEKKEEMEKMIEERLKSQLHANAERERLEKEKKAERERLEKEEKAEKERLEKEEKTKSERQAKEARDRKIFYFLAFLILLYMIIYYGLLGLL